MTGKEYAKSRLEMEEEKLVKKFCPEDFGIHTKESVECQRSSQDIFPGACKRCWESEVVE